MIIMRTVRKKIGVGLRDRRSYWSERTIRNPGIENILPFRSLSPLAHHVFPVHDFDAIYSGWNIRGTYRSLSFGLIVFALRYISVPFTHASKSR